MGTHPIFESDFDCLTDFRMASSRIIWGGLGALSLGALGVNSMYTVEGGHRAVIFSRFGGVGGEIKTEGLNFRIPWLEWPLIYDIRARPFKITTPTGTSDLQMVDIGLRVLYRPDPGAIQSIAKNIGEDFAEKILKCARKILVLFWMTLLSQTLSSALFSHSLLKRNKSLSRRPSKLVTL